MEIFPQKVAISLLCKQLANLNVKFSKVEIQDSNLIQYENTKIHGVI